MRYFRELQMKSDSSHHSTCWKPVQEHLIVVPYSRVVHTHMDDLSMEVDHEQVVSLHNSSLAFVTGILQILVFVVGAEYSPSIYYCKHTREKDFSLGECNGEG